MTLLNVGIYMAAALAIFTLRDRLARFQARLFGMETATIRTVFHVRPGA